MDVAENLPEYKSEDEVCNKCLTNLLAKKVAENLAGYKRGDYDYKTYLTKLLTIIEIDKEDKNKYIKYMLHVLEAIKLGPGDIDTDTDTDIKAKIELLYKYDYGHILKVADIKEYYGEAHDYIAGDAERNTPVELLRKYQYYRDLENIPLKNKEVSGGNRRKKAKPKPKPKAKPKPKPTPKPKAKHDDMNMKDVKDLCKANQIKLSKVVNEKRVRFTKKELLTKLKRKKLI
jgi:hypothetical protein